MGDTPAYRRDHPIVTLALPVVGAVIQPVKQRFAYDLKDHMRSQLH